MDKGASPADARSFVVTNRSVLAIAVPMTLAYLTTPLLGLVDTAVVGQFGDAALLGGLAAGALIFDVAVASLVLLAEGAAANILVVDLDVHQGDGTADILRDNPRVFTFSMHGDRNYPVRKIDSDLDLALPDGTGDAAYIERLIGILPKLSGMARWDIVFYNAGVDVHAEDRLGRLSLTNDGVRARDETVIRHFSAQGIPVCGVIGGGYSTDVSALAARHAILFEVAASYAR